MTAHRARYSDFSLYQRLLRQARPYWPQIGALLLLSLLSTPLALLTPFPLKIAVDSVLGDHPLPGFVEAILPSGLTSGPGLLAFAAGLFVAVTLLTRLQTLGSLLLQTYAGEHLVLEFRAQLLRHVQRLSFLRHDAKGTADSIYRIQHDAPSIQSIAVQGVIPFVTNSLTLIAMIYVTALIDWQLALVALAVAPVLYLLTQLARHRVRSQWAEVKNVQSTAASVVQEVLGAIRVVQAFGQEEREHARFVHYSRKGVGGLFRIAFIEGGADVLVGLTLAMGTGLVLTIGVLHVQSSVLTLGELLIVMAYLSQLYIPLQTMSRRVALLQSGLVSAERAFALLDEAPDVTERPNARPLHRAKGAVAFEMVSFAYGRGAPVLSGLSFSAEPGARLGVSGATGAGKTTLVSLLTRFYDPTKGRILLDGVDLRDYQLADLRNQFSIVLQEPVLFATTIADNIAYARPSAGEEEIVAAARAANAHDFIMRLPEAYDTLVGERGMRLSGGERQRIALARAFLKDAPVLILDEPTSSVDAITEAAIMDAMDQLMRGRTTLMIAHRPSTLADCDRLLVIEGGRLTTEASNGDAALGESPAASALAGVLPRATPVG